MVEEGNKQGHIFHFGQERTLDRIWGRDKYPMLDMSERSMACGEEKGGGAHNAVKAALS